MSLGLKFFIIQVATILIFQTSNIIITQTLGPESVTVYNIAYKYFFALGMLFMIILSLFGQLLQRHIQIKILVG